VFTLLAWAARAQTAPPPQAVQPSPAIQPAPAAAPVQPAQLTPPPQAPQPAQATPSAQPPAPSQPAPAVQPAQVAPAAVPTQTPAVQPAQVAPAAAPTQTPAVQPAQVAPAAASTQTPAVQPAQVAPAGPPPQPTASPPAGQVQPVPPGPTAAAAAAPPAERWTVQSGRTVGAGANVLTGALGFPGLELQLLHGLDKVTEVNAHVSFNYAFEGLTESTRFEFVAQVGIRRELATFGSKNVTVAGRFDPGLIIGTSPGQVGLKIPLELELGIPVQEKLTVNGSIGLPMYFTFGDVNAFYVPLLFGAGFEYLLQPDVAITGKLALGPTFGVGSASGSYFTLYVLIGAAYRF